MDTTQVIFLKGKKTVLRPLCKKTDLEKCWQWVNDPDVRQYMGSQLPVSLTEEEQWFDKLGENKRVIALAVQTLEGELIGTMGVHDIHRINRIGTTGAMIGNKAYQGKGFGQDAKITLLDYLFNTQNFRKICSQAIVSNERSIRYNLRCGYKIEGVRRAHMYRDGVYHDEVLLAVFADEWRDLYKAYREGGELDTKAHAEEQLQRLALLRS